MGSKTDVDVMKTEDVVNVKVTLPSVLVGSPLGIGPLVPPVLIGAKAEVELANGACDVVALPPEPVLRAVPELGPEVPVEIGPTVTVEFRVVVDIPVEELGGGRNLVLPGSGAAIAKARRPPNHIKEEAYILIAQLLLG
ncbi:MAG: hypothetical protein Q9186_001407 [Xanthomendoza sp. 1 TL-2023]